MKNIVSYATHEPVILIASIPNYQPTSAHISFPLYFGTYTKILIQEVVENFKQCYITY